MSPLYPRLPVYVTPCPRGRWRLLVLHLSPWNCKSFNGYNYIQAMALHIHTQVIFTNRTAYSLYRIMVMATPTCLCGSLPQRSVQTTAVILITLSATNAERFQNQNCHLGLILHITILGADMRLQHQLPNRRAF